MAARKAGQKVIFQVSGDLVSSYIRVMMVASDLPQQGPQGIGSAIEEGRKARRRSRDVHSRRSMGFKTNP